MVKPTIYHELASELVDEIKEAVDELVAQELEPVAKYYREKNKEAFEVAYKEVKELESDVQGGGGV